jgi:predicted 2-oxoglutarate/Fe(II)-dependent dioxygenase YbiX
MQFSVGDRLEQLVGATVSRRFYSLDSQAGRPVLLVAFSACAPEAAEALFTRIQAARAGLMGQPMDIVPLALMNGPLGMAFASDALASDQIVYMADGADIAALTVDGHPAGVILDRSGRIVRITAITPDTDLAQLCRDVAVQVASEPSRCLVSSAPVLVVPNILPPDLCRDLIAHFEASPQSEGYMASIKDGVAYSKLDETKKKRRDVELTPEAAALHAAVVQVLAYRCAPEIKRAFQADITFADRILLARYDDTGGYFTRHRDNTAPQTAFREFAISINLNTQDYEGGELLFAEFDDHRYSPPAGSAIIFSASLLHEAAPVTKGSRYVLLSFLCSAKAEALHPQNAATAAA